MLQVQTQLTHPATFRFSSIFVGRACFQKKKQSRRLLGKSLKVVASVSKSSPKSTNLTRYTNRSGNDGQITFAIKSTDRQ